MISCSRPGLTMRRLLQLRWAPRPVAWAPRTQGKLEGIHFFAFNLCIGCIRREINCNPKEVVLTLLKEFSEASSTILCTVLVTASEEGCTVAVIDRVQRRATRSIPGLVRLSLEECLKETRLYTWERRWLREDLFEMFKVMKGVDKRGKVELYFSAEWTVIEPVAIGWG